MAGAPSWSRIAVAVLVAACGSPGPAPVGRPAPPARPLPSANEIEDLVISDTGSCAVLRGRDALCWGAWGGAMIKVATAAAGLRGVAELRVGHDIKLDPQPYYDHLCYRDDRGAVACWGNDQQGQLGGDPGDAPTPNPVTSLPPALELALGKRHSCALTRDRAVYCWGSNAYGECGAGENIEVRVPPSKVPDLPPAVQIAAGASNTCALTVDHRVYCWGGNFNDQSDGVDQNPVHVRVWKPREVVPARGTRVLAAGLSTLCGIADSGNVLCWGFVRDLLGEEYARRSSGQLPGLTGATALGLGETFGCALRADGSVWCFGKGQAGELGRAAASAATSAPAVVSLPGRAIALSVGPQSACARLEDRSWSCWGANRSGEIGPRGQSPIRSPRPLVVSELDLVGR